jgi:hypothetical protein
MNVTGTGWLELSQNGMVNFSIACIACIACIAWIAWIVCCHSLTLGRFCLLHQAKATCR